MTARARVSRIRSGQEPSPEEPFRLISLRPGEAVFKTFRFVSDEPEDVICARYFKLSVIDTKYEGIAPLDTIEWAPPRSI